MAERQYPEVIDGRVPRFGLAGILAAAAILRYWGLGHGIPYAVNVDEPEIVERALNMMRSGSLNPHGFFDYPGLSIYLQFAVSVVHFLAGAITGHWNSLGQVTIPSFYWWGRAFTATVGVATVFVLFLAAMRWGNRHALLAGGLLAVMPLHVTYSHYVLTDTPLGFFTAVTLLLSLVAHERNTTRAFVWAGAAAGFAASVKYNGGIAILMPIVAILMARPDRSSKVVRILLVGAASLVAFLATAPYTVLDLPGFLNGFGRLAGEYRNNVVAEPVWLLYIKHLRLTFGMPALVLAIAGIVIAAVRSFAGPGRPRWAIPLVFTVVYFFMIAHQNIVFARYLLPIVPLLCLFAACAVVSGVGFLRRFDVARAPRTALVAVLTVAALLPPAIQAVQFDRMIARRGTTDMAYEWIVANMPRGARVTLESRKIVLAPGTFDSRNVKTLLVQPYDVYVSEGIEYVVASSQVYGAYFEAPQQYPREYAGYMTLFGQMRELARYTPDAHHPGPELRIFKVRP